MATQAKGGGSKAKGGSKRPAPDPYRIPVGVVSPSEQHEESVMGVLGWVMAVLLVALMLPLWLIVYFDNLQVHKTAEELLKKIDRLEQRLERKERDKDRKNSDTFNDNPVFGRMPRSVSLPVSRPPELGKTRM